MGNFVEVALGLSWGCWARLCVACVLCYRFSKFPPPLCRYWISGLHAIRCRYRCDVRTGFVFGYRGCVCSIKVFRLSPGRELFELGTAESFSLDFGAGWSYPGVINSWCVASCYCVVESCLRFLLSVCYFLWCVVSGAGTAMI